MNSKMIKLKYLTINEKIEEMNTCTFNVIDYINHDNTEYSFNGDLITLYYYKTSKITIKKVIKLSKELAWFIGFYFAEGTKSKNTFAFSNCNTTLFNMCISICQKNLGIPNNSWKLYLTTNKNGLMSNSLKNNFNQSEIGIKINKLSLRDNLEARINNRILVYIFNELTDNFIHRIITDRELSIHFLRGYCVGDGSINVRNGFLYSINITAKNKKYVDYITKAFTTVTNTVPNKRMTKGVHDIYYANVEIITHLIIHGFFSEYKKQWYKLLHSYIKKQYVRSHLIYWKSIENSKLSAIEISKLTDKSHWAVRDAMNRDIRIGIVSFEKSKKKDEKGPFKRYFFLTNKGKELLEILNTVKKR